MERYEDAKQLLKENRKKLDSIAEFLYKKETITGKEFMDIFHQCEMTEGSEELTVKSEESIDEDSENTPGE